MMASNMLDDNRNWVRAAIGLKYLKEGLENIVENEISNLQTTLLQDIRTTNDLPPTETCNQCTLKTILSGKCPKKLCDKIAVEIGNQHRLSHRDPKKRLAMNNTAPCWKNTDVTQWCSSPWEIAKCFMANGYAGKMSAKQTDLTGILSVLINCLSLQNTLSARINPPNDILSKMRETNNKIMHSSTLEVTDAELQQYIDDMIDILDDSKTIQTHPDAVTARTKLNQIKTNTFVISSRDELELRKKATNSLSHYQAICQQNQNDLQSKFDQTMLSLAQAERQCQQKQDDIESNQSQLHLTMTSLQTQMKQVFEAIPTANSDDEIIELERYLQNIWPNENAMQEPVIVKCCDSQSEQVKNCLANPKVYSLKKEKRGTCLIVSNNKFSGPLKVVKDGNERVLKVTAGPRPGTKADVNGLKTLFDQLHFTVVIKEDLSAAELRKVLQQESINITSQDECFVCIICSHGNNNGICGTDGEIVRVDDITTYFDGENCPALVDKPKIFFIQACRGGGRDEISAAGNPADAVPFVQSYTTMPDISIPTKADMVVAYSTHQGYVSFRDPAKGSWFIQAVIYVFQNDAWNEHVLDMLTEVNDRVAKQSTQSQDGRLIYRQASTAQNSLRKKMYFFPGVFES